MISETDGSPYEVALKIARFLLIRIRWRGGVCVDRRVNFSVTLSSTYSLANVELSQLCALYCRMRAARRRTFIRTVPRLLAPAATYFTRIACAAHSHRVIAGCALIEAVRTPPRA